MAILNVQTLADPVTADIAFAAASGGGDLVPNDAGGVTILILNNDASAKTVTIKSYYTSTPPAGLAKSDKSLSVSAGGVGMFRSLDASIWNNNLKQIEITYSAVTNVKVAVIRGA